MAAELASIVAALLVQVLAGASGMGSWVFRGQLGLVVV
jgi:hypothetical protein